MSPCYLCDPPIDAYAMKGDAHLANTCTNDMRLRAHGVSLINAAHLFWAERVTSVPEKLMQQAKSMLPCASSVLLLLTKWTKTRKWCPG